MKRRNLKRQWPLLLTSAVLFALPLSTTAEDIDIFSGSSGGSGANVLVIVDNTTNWSDKKQKWPGNEVQGQAELEALIAVVPTLNDNVNVGLMLFNENRAALLAELNNILANFNDTANTAASNASYSMALLDAYKYLGGFTSPAHATDDVAGSPQDAFHFGTAVFASPPRTFNRPDPLGYTDSSFTVYQPPAAATQACGGKNYLIFIGNGFPNSDTPPTLNNMKDRLAGVGGSTTQIPMPVLTTKTSTSSTNLGYSSACYNNNGGGQNSCNSDNDKRVRRREGQVLDPGRHYHNDGHANGRVVSARGARLPYFGQRHALCRRMDTVSLSYRRQFGHRPAERDHVHRRRFQCCSERSSNLLVVQHGKLRRWTVLRGEEQR